MSNRPVGFDVGPTMNVDCFGLSHGSLVRQDSVESLRLIKALRSLSQFLWLDCLHFPAVGRPPSSGSAIAMGGWWYRSKCHPHDFRHPAFNC